MSRIVNCIPFCVNFVLIHIRFVSVTFAISCRLSVSWGGYACLVILYYSTHWFSLNNLKFIFLAHRNASVVRSASFERIIAGDSDVTTGESNNNNNNASHLYCSQKCKKKLIGALKVITHRQNVWSASWGMLQRHFLLLGSGQS